MQTPDIRHDALERMIDAYRFFAALLRRLRGSGSRDRMVARPGQQQPATAA